MPPWLRIRGHNARSQLEKSVLFLEVPQYEAGRERSNRTLVPESPSRYCYSHLTNAEFAPCSNPPSAVRLRGMGAQHSYRIQQTGLGVPRICVSIFQGWGYSRGTAESD